MSAFKVGDGVWIEDHLDDSTLYGFIVEARDDGTYGVKAPKADYSGPSEEDDTIYYTKVNPETGALMFTEETN